MSKISGSCLCGAIRYTSVVPPLMTAVCHCTNCQKQSGSAFSINVALPKGALQFSAGQPAVYEDTGGSGKPVHRHFCAACGSPIYSNAVSAPQFDWLKAGTLDDTSWVKPIANVWCDSAQKWVAFAEGVPKFPKNPPGA